jgi:glycine oxidase
VVVGASVEEKGFDLSVQAGAVGDLLDDARRLVPSLEEYELVETTTGLRPGSPDNGPIVGETGIPGLVMATGHYRNGILLAPLTATEVTRVLNGGGTSGDADDQRRVFAPFAPDRFHPAPTGRPVMAPPAGGLAPVRP